MKIHPVGTEVVPCGRTNMKLVIVFRNSAYVPNELQQLKGHKEAHLSLCPFRLGLFLPDPDNGAIMWK